MKKVFLIVIYKKMIKESPTCIFFKEQNILNCKDNKLYIWDNSPDEINSSESAKCFFSAENVTYIHTPENCSLSKIYNTIFDENINCEAIQIFDQDSYIKKENYDTYLENILASNANINVFLPKIYSGKTLYSPGKLLIFKGAHYKTLKYGVNKNRHYTAIGSGIMVRPQYCVEKRIRFSEELKLYSVDTDFTHKLCKASPYFYVMDLEFIHDLSENSLSDEEKKKRRKTQLEGLLVVYKNEFFKKTLTKIYISSMKLIGRV